MKILSGINNFTSISYSNGNKEQKNLVSFNSNCRIIPDSFKTVKRNTTYLFRDDGPWKELQKIIETNFNIHRKNNKGKKINILIGAGSDGSESYTIKMKLIKIFGEKEFKRIFAPIISIDIDPYITKIAKSGKINISDLDILSMQKHKININKNFIALPNSKFGKDKLKIENDSFEDIFNYLTYIASPKLRKNIIFKNANFVDEITKYKDDGNSIILFRNVFPYLEDKDVFKIIEGLKSNLKSKSIFVIGNYDLKSKVNIINELVNAGFKQNDENFYIFEKIR